MVRTHARRIGEHTREQRERPAVPEPTIGSKISGAISSVGQSIKSAVSPGKSEPKLSPEQAFQEKVAEYGDINQPSAKQTDRRERYKASTFRDKVEHGKQILREQLAGDTEPIIVQPKLTREERISQKQAEREAKRNAWRSSPDNANNRKKSVVDTNDEPASISESALKKTVRSLAKDTKTVSVEPEPLDEPLPIDTEPKQKVKLYGTGDKYRTDQDGILYRKQDGKWVSTGKPSQYGVPKVVSEDEGEPDLGGGGGEVTVRSRKERGLRSGGKDMDLGSGSGMGGRSSEPQGALSVDSGILGGRVSGASKYNESEERARLAEYDRAGSSLSVGSGYLSAGGYSKGYNAERERARLDRINRAGSPLSAGLDYLSAGGYGTFKPKLQPETGKLDITNQDVFSTGQFNMHYGTKKKKPIDAETQLNTEMAKLTAMTARAQQIQQLSEIQKLQQSMQQQTGIEVPNELVMEEKPKDTMEMLFGMKYAGSSKKPAASNVSATNQLFGSRVKQSMPQKQSGNATTEFFGLKVVPKQTPNVTIGEFGSRKQKHGKRTIMSPKPVIDVKVYDPKPMYEPKNKLPDTKGGLMGIYAKNAPLKKDALPPRIKPSASEYLFGKQN